MQWFNLLSTRTRRLSFFQQNPVGSKNTRNIYLFPAILMALALGWYELISHDISTRSTNISQLLLLHSLVPEDIRNKGRQCRILLPSYGVSPSNKRLVFSILIKTTDTAWLCYSSMNFANGTTELDQGLCLLESRGRNLQDSY